MDELRNKISELLSESSRPIDIVAENVRIAGRAGIEESSTDRDVSTETVCLKSDLLDRITRSIVFAEDDAEVALFERIGKFVLNNANVVRTIFTHKTRERSGYSEYTWWSTVNSWGEVEVIDECELYREIDNFSDTFK